jgi:gluconokinase
VSAAPPALVVMGVAGSGKTTLGEALARRLGWAFKDGDELHPAANVAKMAAGIPLGDDDRAPWLAAIGLWLDLEAGESAAAIVTASALKRRYRDALRAGRPQVRFVFVSLSESAIAARLSRREGHFFPPSLLASQFADLEVPGADEPDVITIDGRLPTEGQAEEVLSRL